MTKRISELPGVGGVADTDELEINQSGVSRKATRGQLVAGLASAAHQHDLADIADAGALAALDTVGTAEIDAAAYASQSEAVAGADNAKVMTALRTAEAIAAQAAAPQHQHASRRHHRCRRPGRTGRDPPAGDPSFRLRDAERCRRGHRRHADHDGGPDRRGDCGKGGGAASPARSRRHRRCRRAGGARRRRHRRDRCLGLRIAERRRGRHRRHQDHDGAAHRRGDRGAAGRRASARSGRHHGCRRARSAGQRRHRRDQGRGLRVAQRRRGRHRRSQDHDGAAHRRSDRGAGGRPAASARSRRHRRCRRAGRAECGRYGRDCCLGVCIAERRRGRHRRHQDHDGAADGRGDRGASGRRASARGRGHHRCRRARSAGCGRHRRDRCLRPTHRRAKLSPAPTTPRS